MSGLVHSERPAAGDAQGLLVLHHGRGADEHDLLGLADALDPQRLLDVVTPGGPLRLEGWKGRHWYVVPRVGYPDPASFAASFEALADLHDELWQVTGLSPAQTILGGFSMGTVMSYALGLSGRRPAPAGILAFSGFLPTVAGWQADLPGRAATRVFLAHGRADPVIGVALARAARELLEQGGLEVSYHESDVAHQIDPRLLPAAASWVTGTLGLSEERSA